MAGAVQILTEKIVCNWIKNGLERYPVESIFLSGGVFMNVKLNQKISEIEDIQNLYLMPLWDESNKLVIIILLKMGKKTKPLKVFI